MKNFNLFPAETARQLHYILFDIDDTITTNGRLTAEAYAALWALHENGLILIPVTGRPAGWCDMIIRQWPVRAVIGENGAFAFYWPESSAGGYAELTHPQADPKSRKYLSMLRDICLEQVPGCRVARDQFARRYDLAIDFCEDEPKLGLEAANAIRDICVERTAKAKVSSIHVNIWFGDYDKQSMAKMLLTEVFSEKAPEHDIFGKPTNESLAASYLSKSLYFGDSPNDEPMFGLFPYACAVANIHPFLDQIKKRPAYVTGGESGLGFAQAAAHLLTLRGAASFLPK